MEKVTNEDLYAAMVAVLAKAFEEEKSKKGVCRLGGSYVREALDYIAKIKTEI